MKSERDAEAVVEYATQNRDNFEMACLVGSQFDAIRRAVVDSFADRLAANLRNILGAQWQIDTGSLWERYKGIRAYKQSWRSLFDIGLEADKLGAKNMYFGVRKGGRDLDELLGSGELKTQLDEGVRKGWNTRSWEWFQYLEPPYLDWDNRKALLAMYGEAGEASEYIVGQLRKVIRIAEPIIDRHLLARK